MAFHWRADNGPILRPIGIKLMQMINSIYYLQNETLSLLRNHNLWLFVREIYTGFLKMKVTAPCADPESFVIWGGGGSNYDNVVFLFFSLMMGGRIKIPLLASHQRPASEAPY